MSYKFVPTHASKLDGIETLATADQTGAEIKASYEAEADTNAYDDAAVSKLSGIETSADVTDAINVDAAGAVMESDTTTATMSFVIDEDDMTSNSDTKVPTQQSVKAYVDASADILTIQSKVFADTPVTASLNEFIKCDATNGNIIVDLPAASGNSGKRIYVKKTDSSGNTVTVDGNSTETIDGSTTQALDTQYESFSLLCDGTNWQLF